MPLMREPRPQCLTQLPVSLVVLDGLMRGLGIPGSEPRPKKDVIELEPPAAFFLSAVHSQIMSPLTAVMEMNGFRQGKDTAERED